MSAPKSTLSEQLLRLREKRGHRSTLSFFKELESRTALGINYTQYKRIENGTVTAQAELVRRLALAYPDEAADLIRAHCRDLFPENADLFTLTEPAPKAVPLTRPLLHPQDELTPRQVAVISASKIHYYVYLILTMARKALSPAEFEESLAGFQPNVLADFVRVKLAFRDGDASCEAYRAISIERVFPSPDSPNLQMAYARMDAWDLEFVASFRTEKIAKRTLIRRVSPRYLPILQRYAELFIEQLYASDETDPDRNVESISFVLDIRKVALPG